MYYVFIIVLYIENVKYLKTCSGLQDQRSAGAYYNLIDSVLVYSMSLLLNPWDW